MIEVLLLGLNGNARLPVLVDATGQVQIDCDGVVSGQENAQTGATFESALMMGQYENTLVPLLVNSEGEIIRD